MRVAVFAGALLALGLGSNASASPLLAGDAIRAAPSGDLIVEARVGRGGGGRRVGGRPVARPAGRPGRPIARPNRPNRPVVRPNRPGTVVVRPGWSRPGSYWWRPGTAVAAGAAIGFTTAAAAAAWAGPAPSSGMCWYYTDASRRQGFWDECP